MQNQAIQAQKTFWKQNRGSDILAVERYADWCRCKIVNSKPYQIDWFWMRDWILEKEFSQLTNITSCDEIPEGAELSAS